MQNPKFEPAAQQQKAPTAADIAAMIATEQDNLATINERRKNVAYTALTDGNIGTSTASINAEAAASLARINDLQAAYTVAVEADERLKREQYAEHHKSEIRSCRQHLLARDKAAAAMSSALEEAIKQWHILRDQSVKARGSIVVGKWPNVEGFVDFIKIKEAVETELFRLGGDGSLGNKLSFPGAFAHNMAFLNQPQRITPIATKLSEASEFLLNTLSGKVSA